MSDGIATPNHCQPSYTPPSAHATWWRLTHSDGSTKEALGQTAFYACANAKWQVGEVVKFEQIPEPSKGPAERIRALLASRKAQLDSWDASYPKGSEWAESRQGKLHRAKAVTHIEYLERAVQKADRPKFVVLDSAAHLHKQKDKQQDDHEFTQARLQGAIDAAEEVEGL